MTYLTVKDTAVLDNSLTVFFTVHLTIMKQSILTFFTGMAMGLADLVPWVSWGTIVFISWLYNRFVSALAAIDHSLLTLLLQWKFKEIRKRVDWWFLMTLLGWIVASVALFSSLIDWLLSSHPLIMWSLFWGFVFGCCLILGLQYWVRTAPNRMAICIALWSLLWRFLTSELAVQLPAWWVWVFLAWAVWSIAMILPGLSGSYILVILWVYEEIIWTISSLFSWNLEALLTVAFFAAWIIAGLLLFSKLLKWFITHFEVALVLVLVGLMLWALPTLLPTWIEPGWFPVGVFGAFVVAASLTGWLMSER